MNISWILYHLKGLCNIQSENSDYGRKYTHQIWWTWEAHRRLWRLVANTQVMVGFKQVYQIVY